MDSQENLPIPLLTPADGVPPLVDSEIAFEETLDQLAQGQGPFAVDAERASGYRFSSRAYLIQIKRMGGGLHLIDPIAFGVNHPLFVKLNYLLQGDEVILHASTQDLPCLREVGIHPKLLFDTELGARIAGLPRVGLAPLLESLMGISLAKEHSAVDWSTRPLPLEWLTYAALDVELLIPLRNKIRELLIENNKLKWAEEDFAAILMTPPQPPRSDPWRKTSGLHKVKKREQLAVVRELWMCRNEIAQEIDMAQGKVLSDSAIIALALSPTPITKKKDLETLLKTVGLRARWLDYSATWMSAISNALVLNTSQLPEMKVSSDALPPVKVWRDKFPDKYAPLSHARARLSAAAEALSLPLENLISPEIVRRICWSKPGEKDLAQALLGLGARTWQVEIVTPILAGALREEEPLVEIDPEASEEE